MTVSELVGEGFRRWPRRVAGDPVGIGIGIKPEVQRTFANQPHKEPHGREDHEEHQPQDDWRNDVMQEDAQPEPEDIQRVENARRDDGHGGEHASCRQPRPLHAAAPPKLISSHNREDSGKEEPKTAVRSDGYILASVQILMR